MSSNTSPHYRHFFESHTVQARIAELQRIRAAYKKKQEKQQSMLMSLFDKQLLARVLEQIQELVSQARTYVHAQEQAQSRTLAQVQADFLAQKQAQEQAAALERQKDRKRPADAPLRVVFKRRQSTRGGGEYSQVAVVYVQQENGRKRRGDNVEELPDQPPLKQQRSRSC